MKSDSPTTCRHNRLIAFIHKTLCGTCRRSTTEWSRLSHGIERLEDDAFPQSLDDKLLSDAMTASTEARARHASPPERFRAQGVFAMKRTLLVTVFAVLMVAVGFWLLPGQKGDTALADVAHAMAKLESAHFVGWYTDHATGQRRRYEGWIKGSSRIRVIEEGRLDELIQDGRSTRLVLDGPEREAIIQPAEDVEPDISLSLFQGFDAVQALIERERVEVASTGNTALPDGREARVTELRSRSGARGLLYTDPTTDLVIRWEAITSDGRLDCAIERFEYNTDIPDSVFRLAIPKGVPVVDLITPPTPEKLEWRQAQKQRLLQEHARIVLSIPRGEGGSDFHPGYWFKCISSGGLLIFYVPDENAYWVLGTARITGPNGFSRIAEDRAIKLPGEPRIYEVLMDSGKPGSFCSAEKVLICGYECVRFVNVGAGLLTVKWDKARSVFVIEGKARLLPKGDIYTDQTVDLYWGQLAKIGKPVWTGLPEDEAAVAREEFDILKRRTALTRHEDRSGDDYINGGKVELMCTGNYYPRPGLTIQPAGRAEPYFYTVPSQERYYVVGTAKVKAKGRPDEVVKNGIVSFSGEVLESE